MTRAEIVTWIGQRYGAYLTVVNRPADDTPAGLGPALDDAERSLTITALDYPLDDDEKEDMLIMTAYLVMEQVVRDMGPQFFNVSTGGDSFSLQQIRLAAEKDLTSLRGQVSSLLGGGLLTLNLNFLSREGGEVVG